MSKFQNIKQWFLGTKDGSAVWPAVLLNTMLFATFLSLATPGYYSTEDAYNLYNLAGGFGEEPTVLLHYNYGMHPLLNFFIQSAFLYLPGFNWYSIALLLVHFLSCCCITTVFFNRYTGLSSRLVWVMLFLVFECPLLLQIGFSNTSMILATTALVILNTRIRAETFRPIHFVSISLVFLLASCFRMHVILPLAGISTPFLFIGKSRRLQMLTATCILCSCILIIGFHLIQVRYYQLNITGWDEEESYRQRMYDLYNNSHSKHVISNTYALEFGMVRNGLPADQELLSEKVLKNMYEEVKAFRNQSASKTPGSATQRSNDTELNQTRATSDAPFYWFVINNRLLLLAALLVFAIYGSNRSSILQSVSSLVLLACGLTMLAIRYRAPEYLLLSGLFAWVLLILTSPVSIGHRERWSWWKYAAVTALITWGIIRVIKISNANHQNQVEFSRLYPCIIAGEKKLVIGIGQKFPMNKIPILTDPRDYPLLNLLDSDHFMMKKQGRLFAQFGIHDLKGIPGRQDIYFYGSNFTLLKDYYARCCNQTILLDTVNIQSGCSMVRIKLP